MPSDEHPEIAAALRSCRSAHVPPPGLEVRILKALEDGNHPASSTIPIGWTWLVLSAAAALALLAVVPRPTLDQPAGPPEVAVAPPSSGQALAPAQDGVTGGRAENPAPSFNPLEAEALALSRDAQRAGRFLIAHLPSLSVRQE